MRAMNGPILSDPERLAKRSLCARRRNPVSNPLLEATGQERYPLPMSMTALDFYAHHGSTSYGALTSARLREIILGAAPGREETPRVCQALTETAGYKAYELAEELGLEHEDIDARTRALCGCGLPP